MPPPPLPPRGAGTDIPAELRDFYIYTYVPAHFPPYVTSGAEGGGDDGDLVQHKSGVDELKKRLAGAEEALAASDDALSAAEKALAGAEEALAVSEEARAISEAALAISTGRIAELEAEVEGLRGNSFSC